jgi:hypothetical protein
MIARFLTLFDLAVFGCINRECKRLAEEELCTITMLHSASKKATNKNAQKIAYSDFRLYAPSIRRKRFTNAGAIPEINGRFPLQMQTF